MACILILEGDTAPREALWAALSSSGHQVRTADCASEARALLAAEPVDAIIVDDTLTARATDSALELLLKRPELCAVLLTEFDELADAWRPLSQRANVHVVAREKNQHTLLSTLNELVRTHSTLRPTDAESTDAAAMAPALPSPTWQSIAQVAWRIDRSGTLRALVLEEDEAALATLLRVSQGAGVTLRPASSRREACALARRETFDALFVSLDPAEPEGLADFVATLRGSPELEALPLVGVWSRGRLEDRLRALEAGIDLLVNKPVRTEDLVLVAHSLLTSPAPESARIVVLDDEPLIHASIGRLLRQSGWRTYGISDPHELFDTLRDVEPDLLLLDVRMSIGGLGICRVLRTTPRWQDLPVVFLTGATDEATLTQCFEAGGTDYLTKPIVAAELRARVRLHLERSRLYQRLAHHDQLTGLMVEAAFVKLAEQRVAQASRYGRSATLVVLDIDGLAAINDEHGTGTGDLLLRSLGRLLQTRVRAEDIRGRLGKAGSGAEVAALLYDTELEAAALAAERIIADFEALNFEGLEGELLQGQISFGMACHPSDQGSFSDLLATARGRLRRNKQTRHALPSSSRAPRDPRRPRSHSDEPPPISSHRRS